MTPNASDNLPDHGAFTGSALEFTDDGALPGAPVHHYAALVGRRPGPRLGRGRGDRRQLPRPAARPRLHRHRPDLAAQRVRRRPVRQGHRRRAALQLTLPAGGSKTLWIAVAGSDKGLADAQSELAGALQRPRGRARGQDRLARRAREADAGLAARRPAAAERVDWGKQNLADLTQTASDLQIRWTNQGKQFPAPLGTVAHARWIGAGFPDYPWIFGTDGEYTAFAAVALGQFEAIKDHLRALRDISDILNNRSGVVVHEAVSDGSIWFGHDSQTTAADGTKTNDFNTDETVKFPSAVALIWRWTGDNRFRDEMYDFAVRNLQVVDQRLDADHDGWPEGSGNVERPGMGPEKLDNAVYFIRGLYDLADMARSKHDGATFAVGHEPRRASCSGSSTAPGGTRAPSSTPTRCNDPGNVQSFQKHWIGQTPMEAELNRGDQATPGVASYDHGTTALAGRENACFSGDRPVNPGLFHTGCGGGPDGKGEFEIFSLTTSIQSVGEGNYGRLGAGQQQRYTHANAETMFSEPATGGTPDEQPGAMPEIFPSAPNGDPARASRPNIDRCWTCRSMFMQAWGNYGTAWPVVHQQLGVRPTSTTACCRSCRRCRAGQPSVAGSNIRLGRGSVDVLASHSDAGYTTKVDATQTPVRELVIGHTLPRGPRPATVLLDGRRVKHYDARETNRGLEVTVAARPGAQHTLTITTASPHDAGPPAGGPASGGGDDPRRRRRRARGPPRPGCAPRGARRSCARGTSRCCARCRAAPRSGRCPSPARAAAGPRAGAG